jgi:glutamate/tyrosine decarboxylase-like PLP-dependent enzyme
LYLIYSPSLTYSGLGYKEGKKYKFKMKPDSQDYDLEPSERQILNKIRLKYFLDPAGSNKGYFRRLTRDVLDSLLGWYLPGEDSTLKEILDSDEKLSEFAMAEIDRQLENADLRFDIGEVKKPVDRSITFSEARETVPVGFPEKLEELTDVLCLLDEQTNPSIRFNQRFMGEQHPNNFMPSLIAGFVAKFINQNAVAQKVSPTTTYMEKRVVEWLRESAGYAAPAPNQKLPGGNIVSGGTLANLTGLITGRNRQLTYDTREVTRVRTKEEIDGKTYIGERFHLGEKEFDALGNPKQTSIRDVGFEGIRPYLLEEGFSGVSVFVSARSHYSLKGKLANVSGIGSDQVISVKADGSGRMDPDDLEAKIKESITKGRKPIAILATAGTTEEGAIDPLREIGEIAEANGIYFHVDAAHGGGFLISPEFREKFDGIELADSITIDGHKMLYTHYPCGGIIFKDPETPARQLQQSASYIWADEMNPEDHANNGSQTIEGSRGTDGIFQIYAGMKALGREGYDLVQRHTHNLTRYLYDTVEWSDDFTTEHPPGLNVLLFRYEPQSLDAKLNAADLEDAKEEILDLINEELPKRAYDNGEFYVGGTGIEKGGETVHHIRAIIMHPYTETETVDSYLEYVKDLGDTMLDEEIQRRTLE